MFRFKKRDEGFEWHQYVRTTIKLRREARRDKAQKLGEQVAGGARVAGATADKLAKNGAKRLGDAARASVVGLGRSAVAAMAFAGLGVGWIARIGTRAVSPVMDLLGRPGIGGPLTFIGLIATVTGLVRGVAGPRGFDVEAFTALGIGVVLLLLGMGPSLWRGHAALPKRAMAPITGLPSRPWLVAAGSAVVLLIAGIGLKIAPVAVPSVSLPQVASFETFSLSRSDSVSGKAQVLAADTLRIGKRRVRLASIEVPDANQRCLRAGARAGGRTWACGQDAKEAMQRLVGARTVSCEVGSADEAELAHGRCKADGTDLGEALVRAGFAFASGSFMPTFSSAQSEAQAKKSGIWSSAEPERPAQWRDRVWAEAKSSAPDGCPIKGSMRGRKRVYLMPWDTNYPRVRIRSRRGERWFCSENEAASAGWQSISASR